MEKFKTVKKIIDGVEYTAQFNGLSAALEAVDNSYIDGSSNTSSLKMAKYILENVIVAPRVDIDSFENAEKLNNVLDFGNFTHDYVFNHMTPQEVLEANIALDKAIKQIESKSKKGR